jgi:hypothetical protein
MLKGILMFGLATLLAVVGLMQTLRAIVNFSAVFSSSYATPYQQGFVIGQFVAPLIVLALAWLLFRSGSKAIRTSRQAAESPNTVRE